MTTTTAAGVAIRVRHRPAGWVMRDFTDLEGCTSSHLPVNADQPPCIETAVWRVVEDHGLHLTVGFWCDRHLPGELARLAAA